ncbi:MAG: DUF5703 domain-containing protein [Phycisphaerae bacterium]|nr:DUF5703 domain-containing protein [Phycisphaerae bacterium]
MLLFALAMVALGSGPPAADPLSESDVVWTTPSRDDQGSMPIGNGDLAANVWITADGVLSMYLAKSDAWDENARLLKLGLVRVQLDPPLAPDASFRQRLDLREGEIEIELDGSSHTSIRVRVDANHPQFIVDITTGSPTTLLATLDHWRLAPRTVQELAWSDVFCLDLNRPPTLPLVTEPDTFLPPVPGRSGAELVWYHRNDRTPIPITFWLQGLTSLLPTFDDPILFRTFGSLMTGDGLVASGDRSLRSISPATQHALRITALTMMAPEERAFAAALRDRAAASDAVPSEGKLRAHRRWWDAFWERSFIRVHENSRAAPYRLPVNDLPVSIGSDANGANAFQGTIETVLVYDRALQADEMAALATGRAPAAPALAWQDGDARTVPNGVSLLGGEGLSVAAWIIPDHQAPGGGRIVDKAPVGTAQGWVLDTYPSNSLRFIAGEVQATLDARLEPGVRTLVSATYDPKLGSSRLFINGQQVAETPSLPSAAATVTRGYELQRYLLACAGRGGAPIKFNGSLFTMPRAGHDDGDPDYRRWGPGYWFQNTRLLYWPMFAAGDFDCTEAFFRMYRDAIPLIVARSRAVESERVAPGGGAFHETIYFWGTPDNATFGWRRENAEPGQVTNPYIRHYRSGSIELLAMAIERYSYERDTAFLRATLLPLCDAILTFYASFYPREPNGTIRFEPAASLETWHDATDPLPEIAGLRFLLPQLLALDSAHVGEARRAAWKALLDALPAIPMTFDEGGSRLAPAARFAELANVENPELYAVFPYRLFGAGKPDLDIALRTFDARTNRANVGWCQDSIQAAMLGRGDDAASMIARRAAVKDQRSRFPAFWGPNYDWVPDQDHGANILTTLQLMILQSDGDRILLLPAWPLGWDADFRLHAPKNTTLTGMIRDGRLASLIVSPPERLADVEFLHRQ